MVIVIIRESFNTITNSTPNDLILRMNKLLVVLSFLAIYFIWGTTYLAIVIGLEGFQPFFMATIRFAIAGVLLLTFSFLNGERFPSKSSLVKNAIIGLVVLCGGQGLLIWSEQYIASGYASVLVATIPIWFVILDKKHWKLYFANPYILIGVILGFCGIVILFRDQLHASIPQETIHLQLVASIAVLVGAMFWVIGTLYHRSRPAPGSIIQNLGWQLTIGSLFCLIISSAMGEWNTPLFLDASLRAWSAVIYLALAGSILAFVAYTWLLQKLPSAIVGTYAYINPVVAVLLGWLLVDEVIAGDQFIGMGIILISAVLVNLNRSKIKTRS